jgi:peptidoglycan/LPS O-acetylase OafA/YrhL
MKASVAPAPKELSAQRAGADQLPSLNGLRALSVGLVLAGHMTGTRHLGWMPQAFEDFAYLGVVVFFVISGFLITSLLIRERGATGRISLKLFYMRRAIRIFPAAYAFMVVISLLWCAGIVRLKPNDLLHAASYTVNLYPCAAWPIAHLWSLSVEEQFYLLWPFAVFVLGPRRSGLAAAGMMLLGPVARTAAWLLLRGTVYRSLPMFPMVADSLAAGCLLAELRPWLETQSWYLRLFRPAYSCAMLAAVIVVNQVLVSYTITDIFGRTMINIFLAILVHRSVFCAEDRVGRVLNWKPFASIGVLSYSIYVWQQIFLNRYSNSWWTAFPENLALSIAAALASYVLLEKPFLRLRARFRSGSAEEAAPEPQYGLALGYGNSSAVD